MSITFLTDKDKLGFDESINHLVNRAFTPQMYGAVGDGVNDDTQAIQDAIDAAASESGSVYLPVGNYLVTSTITVQKGVVVSGSGKSIIRPACETAFYLQRDTTLEGFMVHILAEYSSVVQTVFLIDQSSTMANGRGIDISFNNLYIFNSATEPNNNYTVWDIHSADGAADGTSTGAGFCYVRINNCDAQNNIVMGYAARIYSYKSDWVSSVIANGCTTQAFRWHWFFMPSEELCHSTDYSYHNSNCTISNCCGQWGQGSMGFIYAANANTLRLFNNTTWDWGSASNTGVVTPYIFNKAFYTEGALISDIREINGNFGEMQEDGTVEIPDGSGWWNRVFYEYRADTMPMAIGCGGLRSADAYKVGACLIWSSQNAINANYGSIRFTLVDEYGRHNHIILTKTAAYVDYLDTRYKFAFAEDYKKCYIVATGNNIPRNLIAIPEPLFDSMYSRYKSSNGQPKAAQTIRVYTSSQDEVYLSTVPDGLVDLSKIVNPNNNIIYSPNGTAYKLTVADDGTLAATAATVEAIYPVP